MSFAQGAPTQPLVLQGSNVFLYGSSTAGNAFTVQQLGAGNVASFQTSTSATSLIINPSGYVGIGKTNPAYALDVTGDLNFTGTFRQNGTPYIGSQWTGTSTLYFVGNVGINTTSVANPLTVNGTVVATTFSGSAASLTSLPMGQASGTLAIANGGTGQTTASAAFNALSPMTTAGDLIYGGTSGAGTRLATGTATQLLHGGTTPTWSAISLTADVSGTLPVANGGTGQTTASAAFNALSPMTTAGDLIYGGTSGAGTRLATGTATQLLHGGTTPTWSAISLTADVSGTLPVANGGTGQTTAQAAMNALAGAQTNAQYLRGNGTNVVMSAIQAADVPTLNQNTTGSAASATTATNQSGGTVSATTGSFSGTITLPTGGGTNEIGAGTGDNATYSTYNVYIKTWYGLAIRDYANTVRMVADARSGTWDVIGGYKINGTTVIDSSRNLTNIGTIGSGAITATTGTFSSTVALTEANANLGLNRGAIWFNGNGDLNHYLYNNYNNRDGAGAFDGMKWNVYAGLWIRGGASGANTGFFMNISGNVGIGTTSPAYKQHVYNADSSVTYYGPNATWSAYLMVGAGGNHSASQRAQVMCSNGNLHIDCGQGAYQIYLNYYQGGGNGGTNATVGCYAAFTATGDITAFSSDERLKTKVGLIENALDKVCSLTAFKYTHNDIARQNGFTDDNVYVGLSAQEVQKVLPEVVKPAPFDQGTDYDVGKGKSKSGENYLTIQYERLVPLLVEALKEERSERLRLQDRLERLERLLSQDRTR